MTTNHLMANIINFDAKIAVVGLGYVGLPLAVEFGCLYDTIGFDISIDRIKKLQQHEDPSGEIHKEQLNLAKRLIFTNDPQAIARCTVFIVAVPTPVDKNNRPDRSPLVSASQFVGQVLKTGDLVVYESTVYPGCTEDDCVPVLEKNSQLKLNRDFFVGYSPERINPGDKQHSLTNIVKITSGSTIEVMRCVDALYRTIVVAGTCPVKSIKIAEAAKVIENTQRDLNIAFVNELAMIFNKMGIDTQEVLNAACTKWNFRNYRPGLVGGHCLSVDPFYLAHKAQEYGHHAEVILAGRKINDGMGKYIAQEVVKLMILKERPVKGSIVRIFGCTFKENCADSRNSKVFDIIKELQSFQCVIQVIDPKADYDFVLQHYGIALSNWETSHCNELDGGCSSSKVDAVIMAVAHDEFKQFSFQEKESRTFVIYDVKGVLPNGVADRRL